jgi:hypothetical protein
MHNASSWVPKTTLRFDNLLQDLQNSLTLIYSWLWFIIIKEYKIKSAKERGTLVRVHPQSFQSSSLKGVVDRGDFFQ